MIPNIVDAASNVDNSKDTFRNRKLAICTKQHPVIDRFPVPILKLLAVELEKVERIAKGKGVPTFEDDTMRCRCM